MQTGWLEGGKGKIPRLELVLLLRLQAERKRGDREGTSLGDMGRELLWVLQHQTEEWRFLRVWGRSWLFRLP